jgi:hypothetical protein
MRWIRYVVVAAAVTAPQLCFAEVLDSFVGHFPFDKVNGRLSGCEGSPEHGQIARQTASKDHPGTA